MPGILRLPCVVVNGFRQPGHWRQIEPGHRHRSARRRVARPDPDDPKRRTPRVRRGNKTPPGSNFRWAARKRGERTLLPSAAGRRTSPAPALPGRRAVRGAPGDAQPGRASGNRSARGRQESGRRLRYQPARDGSEFPDSDISGFPRPPAGRDGGAPDSAGAWRTSGRARSPAVVHTPIRQVSKIRFRKSGARGHPRGHPRRTSRPGREAACR